MGKKSRPWVHRDNTSARCDHCGGRSVYRFMWKFHEGSVRQLSYKYWFWWNEFKKRHNKCMEREHDY